MATALEAIQPFVDWCSIPPPSFISDAHVARFQLSQLAAPRRPHLRGYAGLETQAR